MEPDNNFKLQTEEEMKAELYAFAEKHKDRAEEWIKHHSEAEKLPIIFTNDGCRWLNRAERRKMLKGRK